MSSDDDNDESSSFIELATARTSNDAYRQQPRSDGSSLSSRVVADCDEDALLGIPEDLRDDDESAQLRSSAVRRLPRTLEALLGQANLMYATGKLDEALNMLQEVIRQEPRHPEPYTHMADIYNDLGDSDMSLQYGLLSAHLDYRTPAAEWAKLGELCETQQKLEQAAVCYGRAIRADPHVWTYYESRINVLDALQLTSIAMRTRLQAILSATIVNDFDSFAQLVTQVVQYYTTTTTDDEDKAVTALDAFVARGKQNNMHVDAQFDALLGIWITRKQYLEAARAIFAYCDGIDALNDNGSSTLTVIYDANGRRSISGTFPPERVHRFRVDADFPTIFLLRIIGCFVRLSRYDLAEPLMNELQHRPVSIECEEKYVEVGRSLISLALLNVAAHFLGTILEDGEMACLASIWLCYADVRKEQHKVDDAIAAYRKVIDIDNYHVDARIRLASLLQETGESELALKTLQGYDLDECTELPDERLLLKQADMLFANKQFDQFGRCMRLVLAPYFYQVVRLTNRRIRRDDKKKTGETERNLMLWSPAVEVLCQSQLEKFVKRVGPTARQQHCQLTDVQLHDYCLKLCEVLLRQSRHEEMLHVCCYACIHPMLQSLRNRSFGGLLFLAAIKANSYNLAFEYLRAVRAPGSTRSVHLNNAFAWVFANSQDLRYHRYIMRALYKDSDNVALTIISGNNSLVAGSYRHALGEYLKVWRNQQDDSLLCLLIALTFAAMSCKKDICRRHQLAMRALAFAKKYELARGKCSETIYNFGRLFHQINILYAAVHCYKQVLSSDLPHVVVIDEMTGLKTTTNRAASDGNDLRPLAAHNLALIYVNSGNRQLARQVLEKYCTI